MKHWLKRLMRRYPRFFNPLWSLAYPWIIRRDEKYIGEEYTDRIAAFQTIYDENRWDLSETRSGHGSTINQTRVLRKALENILAELNVKILLDAPCGDFNWMQHVNLPLNARYIGGDIISALVDNLRKTRGSKNRSFRMIDIVTSPLPPAGLWLCRDVLFRPKFLTFSPPHTIFPKRTSI